MPVKKYIILLLMVGLSVVANAQLLHTDSVKIFRGADSLYYMGVYGVGLPASPCWVSDSAKVITADSINIFLCFTFGSTDQICRASDTIYLGSLPDPSYIVTLNLTSADGVNYTCAHPLRHGIVSFYYGTTGINTIGNRDMKLDIYPNPVSGNLNITCDKEFQNVSLQICSTDGRVVIKQAMHTIVNRLEVDVSALPHGMYFLALQDGQRRYVNRFVKE
jgi:hypothetical protein